MHNTNYVVVKNLKKAIIKWHNLRWRYSARASSIVFAVFSSLLTVAVQYFPPEWNLVPTNDRCNFAPVRFVPMTLSCEWVQCYKGEPWWARDLQKSPRYSLRSKRFRAVSDQGTRRANQNLLSSLWNQTEMLATQATAVLCNHPMYENPTLS